MATSYKYILTVTDVKGNNPFTIETQSGSNSRYQITELGFEKRLYSPCSVNIELAVISANATISDVNSDFSSKSAKLEICEIQTGDLDNRIATDTLVICENYIIYQFKPVKDSSTFRVYLSLFSRDKLLTLDKFNKVYLNQKLGSGIIGSMLGSGGSLENCKVKFKAKERLFMQYKLKEDNSVEVIQPYRVQYNEDFYSFISRIACQCGELLYFEDGQLVLGMNQISIKDGTPEYDCTIVNEESEPAYTRVEYPTFEQSAVVTKSFHSNYIREFHKEDSDYPKAFSSDDGIENGLPFTDSGAFDEYFDILDKSDGQLPDSSEFYWPDMMYLALKYVPEWVYFGVNSGAWATMEKMLESGYEAAKLLAYYANSERSVNNTFEEEVFEKREGNTSSFIPDQQSDGADKVSQFADLLKEGFGQLLHDRLFEIRSNEETSAKNKIIIQLDTSFYIKNRIGLGSFVSFEGGSYLVTSCTGRYAINGEITTEIEIVPFQIQKDKSGKIQEMFFYPPCDKCAAAPSVSSQIAVVSADYDPRYMGRVRIRYPWQKSDEKGSPWVRVLVPRASKSGSVHFQPKEGDEVMVGYIDGNVERPYVVGSLVTKDVQWHDSLYSSYDNTISVGSQRLDFRKGTWTSFVSSFIPIVGTVGQFNPDLAAQWSKNIIPREDVLEDLGFQGLTRLTDTNSLWVIEGNTTTRSVTIKSGLGKVTINAYTGINIETEGDISIKGKNISISALNNITVESGVAIKNARKFEEKKATALDIITGIVEHVLDDLVSVDLSLIRTLWESAIPPKEGTLKIKSNRYLALEAGKGAAYDNHNIGRPGENAFKPFACDDELIRDCYKDLNAIHTYVGKLLNEYFQLKRDLDIAAEKVVETSTRLKNARLIFFNNINTEKLQIIHDLRDNNFDHTRVPDYTTIIGVDERFSQDIPVWKEQIEALANLLRREEQFMQDISLWGFANLKKVRPPHSDGFKDICTSHLEILNNDPQVNLNNEKYELFSKVAKAYIEATKEFDFDSDPDNKIIIKSLKLKGGSWLGGVAEDLWENVKNQVSSAPEYGRIYKDSDAKRVAEGGIIMSQTPDESIHIEGNALKSLPNYNVAVIKKLLNRQYTE